MNNAKMDQMLSDLRCSACKAAMYDYWMNAAVRMAVFIIVVLGTIGLAAEFLSWR